MPKYSNSNAVDTFLGWLRIPAKGSIETESMFATLPSGVTQTDLTPNNNPIIYSVTVTGSSGVTTYAIPDQYNNYTIRIRISTGSAVVALNDASLTPTLSLLAGEQVGWRVMNRTIGKVIITGTAATFKLDVCKDSSMSWDI